MIIIRKKSTESKAWGIVLILAALCIILDIVFTAIGKPIFANIPVFRMVLSLLLLFFAVNALIKGDIAWTFFPLAFIFMLLESWIADLAGLADPNIANNWIVLLGAFLLTIGTLLLTSKSSKKVKADCEFGSTTKYVDAASFNDYKCSCRFGDYHICFENADEYKGGGTLTVDNAFGQFCIDVPEGWNIDLDIDSNFGDVEHPSEISTDGPTIRIKGKNSFGEIKIRYI